MTDLGTLADGLNRTVKIALDTGEAASIEAAERIFSQYKLQIIAGPDVERSSVLQAALLTAVNCASRTFLGGVSVVGASGPLRIRIPSFSNVPEAVVALGAKLTANAEDTLRTVVIGDVRAAVEPLAIRATFSEWCGGVIPAARGVCLPERGDFTPTGVLAGAIAVSEVFQGVRGGNPSACRRTAGLDLWRPTRDWMRGESAAPLDRLPSSAWLVGLGNLGQAYLWVLGLLPYKDELAHFVLQDFDVVAPANLSTSMLTTPTELGMRKTRAMARWADARGFKTSIIERAFEDNFRVSPHEPPVALLGVDNMLARQALDSVGFERVIEAGLGRDPQDFMGIDLHTFPASRAARDLWREFVTTEPEIALPAYDTLFKATRDRCGTVRLAGRSVGAPFVGAVAASMVVAELVRLALGGERFELISCHLRDPADRTVVCGVPWPAFNPGTVRLAA